MNAVTGTEETSPIAQIATGEANPILRLTKTVITTEIDMTTTVDLGIVGVHEADTTADLGTDRVTEDMTMDLLGTDRDMVGIVVTMTGRGEETTDLRIAEEMTGMEIVTEEEDLAVDGEIMATGTGTDIYVICRLGGPYSEKL